MTQAKTIQSKRSIKTTKKVESSTGLDFLARLDKEQSFSPKCREDLRTELDRQVQDFLKNGGEIQDIEPNVMADPPKKPQNNYGSRPI